MPELIHPIRLRVQEKLSEVLGSISPENGYVSDLSGEGQVVRGRLFLGDDEPVPMVSIVEPPLAIEQIRSAPRNTARAGDWDILIQGWVRADELNPTDPAYILSSEVCQALARQTTLPSGRPGSGIGPNLLGLGPKITEMHIGAPVVRPPDHESRHAQFYLLLTLKISEDMANPFS